jgi:hypothetical protein
LSIYLNSGSGTSTYTISTFRIVPANDWLTEGTGSAAGDLSLTGEPSFLYCKYNTQQWYGGNTGCTGATDKDATPSDSKSFQWNTQTLRFHTWTITPSWVGAWKLGTHANNGVLIYSTGAGTGTATFASSEATSNVPYWTIGYTPAAAGIPLYMHQYRQRRR